MSRRRRSQIQAAPSAALHSGRLSHMEKVREQLLQQLIEMPPVAFEQLIAHWLKASGYEQVQVLAASTRGLATTLFPAAKPTGSSATAAGLPAGLSGKAMTVCGGAVRGGIVRGGVDFSAISQQGLSSGLTLVQAKQYRIPVSRRFVDELRGAMLRSGAQHGLLITTSTFYGPALQAVALPSAWPVRLIEGSALLDQLFGHRLGVRQTVSGRWQLDRGFLERLSNGCVEAVPSSIAQTQLVELQSTSQKVSPPTDTPKRKPARCKRRRAEGSALEALVHSPTVQATDGLWQKCRALWQRFWGWESSDAVPTINDDR